ncbi:MAG: hypothetical protein HYY93_07110 [Planctomycetes bacterium]|nr:hypothetical protein [Planctomycetota bacterium]
MGAYVDPFEAFKKKADVDRPVRKEEAAATEPSLGPKLDEKDLEGRPKGFATHRLSFGKENPIAKPTEPLTRPKGFDRGRVEDASEKIVQNRPADVPKPKGFDLGKLGSGPPHTVKKP